MTRIFSLWAICVAPFLLSGCLFDLSPDGSQIVVSSMIYQSQTERDTRPTIATLNSDGTNFRTIPNSGNGVFPIWSPDGKFIAFRKDNLAKGIENNKELWIYDLQSETTRLIETDANNVLQWFWRDDSARLLGNSSPKNGNQELLWLDVETQKIVRQVDLKSRFSVGETPPRFLPDSDEAVFLRGGGRGFNLCLTTKNSFKTLATTGDVASFGISKETKQLLWIRQPNRNNSAGLMLFSADFNGQNVRRLPFSPKIPKSDPERGWHSEARLTFSPDAKQLALVDTFPAAPDPKTKKSRQFTACYLIDLQTSKARLIYQTPSKDTPTETEKEWQYSAFIAPKWSRDGKRLVLLGLEMGKWAELSVFDGNGRNSRHVTLPVQNPTQPPKQNAKKPATQ